jgi:hypothetical protein
MFVSSDDCGKYSVCVKTALAKFGIPTYAQFDNATVFTGFSGIDSVGQVIRFCLLLGVPPVFAPRETGFQANVENYNGK